MVWKLTTRSPESLSRCLNVSMQSFIITILIIIIIIIIVLFVLYDPMYHLFVHSKRSLGGTGGFDV